MNDVKEFLILFILFFAAIMIILVAFAAARYILEKQGKETDAVDAAQDYALKIISQVGLLLFTDAEKTFGSGTGALKLSAVMDKLIAKLPVWVTELIDMDWLTEQVELALKRAKDKWQSNPALLNEEGADNGG